METEKLDVVISTLNSGRTIKRCLESILSEIPINRIIVIDGRSTDETLKILKKFPKVVCHVRPDLNLGESRAFGFSLVKTKWFAQIDSDIILRKGWFNRMIQDIDKGDVIEGSRINHYAFPVPIRERGLFGAVLIKTKAVENLQLDCLLLEDELTRRIITKRGFKWFKNGCLSADHYSNPQRYRNTEFKIYLKPLHFPSICLTEMGRIDRISNYGLFLVLKRFLRFYASFLKFSMISFVDTVRTSFLYLKGYMKK